MGSFNGAGHFGTWWPYLSKSARLMKCLNTALDNIRKEYADKSKIVLPVKPKIFRAFRHTPFDDAKTVLIAQEPYHNIYKGEPSACGLAFVTENRYLNPSLTILCKSLNLPLDGDIFKSHMKSNGVLLLNTSLTVLKGQAGSHKEIWAEFSEVLINTVSKAKPTLTWALLGNHAKNLEEHIVFGKVLKSIHPAAYLYKKEKDYKELRLLWHTLKFI